MFWGSQMECVVNGLATECEVGSEIVSNLTPGTMGLGSGCKVIAVAAIVTYEMVTAAENFMEAGIEAVTLTNFSTLLAEQADKVRQFAEDPQVWWGKVGG